MEELELGPNGGLVYCMEYLLDNMDWLKDELDKFDDEEYIIFDCPGQVGYSLASIRCQPMRKTTHYAFVLPKGAVLWHGNHAHVGLKCRHLEKNCRRSTIFALFSAHFVLSKWSAKLCASGRPLAGETACIRVVQ